ncbi:MAG: hypothetical protein PUC00_01290 [Clostridiales bacterium]|nr:hypothetical protein [Clostridiales bacterium]
MMCRYSSTNASFPVLQTGIGLLPFVEPEENAANYQWKNKCTDIDGFDAANKRNESDDGYTQSNDCNGLIGFM